MVLEIEKKFQVKFTETELMDPKFLSVSVLSALVSERFAPSNDVLPNRLCSSASFPGAEIERMGSAATACGTASPGFRAIRSEVSPSSPTPSVNRKAMTSCCLQRRQDQPTPQVPPRYLQRPASCRHVDNDFLSHRRFRTAEPVTANLGVITSFSSRVRGAFEVYNKSLSESLYETPH